MSERVQTGAAAPPAPAGEPGTSTRWAAVRSLLLVDPDAPDLAERMAAPADALILDLASPGAAQHAAGPAMRALRRLAPARLLLVRVGGLRAGLAGDGLDAAMSERPDAILLADCREAADVQHLGVKLAVHEARLGFPAGSTAIVATAGAGAAGLLALGGYAGASPRLAALTWDAAALEADLGAAAGCLSEETEAVGTARFLLRLGARAAGVAALDTSTSRADVAAAARSARRLGFSGKIAADPSQVGPINAAFA